jgi:hypothetical protein
MDETMALFWLSHLGELNMYVEPPFSSDHSMNSN